MVVVLLMIKGGKATGGQSRPPGYYGTMAKPLAVPRLDPAIPPTARPAPFVELMLVRFWYGVTVAVFVAVTVGLSHVPDTFVDAESVAVLLSTPAAKLLALETPPPTEIDPAVPRVPAVAAEPALAPTPAIAAGAIASANALARRSFFI